MTSRRRTAGGALRSPGSGRRQVPSSILHVVGRNWRFCSSHTSPSTLLGGAAQGDGDPPFRTEVEAASPGGRLKRTAAGPLEPPSHCSVSAARGCPTWIQTRLRERFETASPTAISIRWEPGGRSNDPG